MGMGGRLVMRANLVRGKREAVCIGRRYCICDCGTGEYLMRGARYSSAVHRKSYDSACGLAEVAAWREARSR